MVHSFRMLKGSQAESEHRIDIDLSPKTIIYILLATVVLIVISLYHFVAAAPISAELAVLLVVVCTLLADVYKRQVLFNCINGFLFQFFRINQFGSFIVN